MIRAEDFEIIHKRKSVRKYEMRELDDDILDEISGYFKTLTPLLRDIRIEIAIIPGERVGGMGLVKAPHYLVIFSEEKPGYEANAGFIMEQADLFFSSKGLGSCWVGAAKPDNDSRKLSSLKFVINMAFGEPSEDVHRIQAEFTRRPAAAICDFGGDGMTQCVRLAPSAMNSQPWYFTKERGGYGVYRVRSNPVKALIMDPMNKIDMGIALCCAAVYCEKEGKPFQFTPADGQKDGYVRNGLKIGSISMEDREI